MYVGLSVCLFMKSTILSPCAHFVSGQHQALLENKSVFLFILQNKNSFGSFRSFPAKVRPRLQGEAYPDPNGEGRIFLRYNNGSFSRRPSYQIISTDYKSYSLVFACNELAGGAYNIQFAWIVSRLPTMPRRKIKELFALFRSRGIKTRPLQLTPQSVEGNCTYGGEDVDWTKTGTTLDIFGEQALVEV